MAVTRRRVALVIVLVWGGLALAPGAIAVEDAAVFSVSDVAVDVTAADAASARTEARIEGQRRAFERLLKRIVPATDYDRLPNPDDGVIRNLVQGFEVADERVGPNRYIASLTFRFKPTEVGDLLQAHNIAYAVTASRPMVVLPLYRSRDELLLWEDDNSWRVAWANLPPSDGLLPVIIPFGELADITLIDALQAESGQRDRLEALANRYGAGKPVVVEAAVERDALVETPKISVIVRRFDDDAVRIGGGVYSGMAWDSLDAVLATAAVATRLQLEEEWKEANLLHFDHEESLAIDIPLKGLDDWLDIRRRLTGLALVRKMELAALSSRFARVVVHYFGDARQLSGALANRELELSSEADLWVLRRRGESGHDGSTGESSLGPGGPTAE